MDNKNSEPQNKSENNSNGNQEVIIIVNSQDVGKTGNKPGVFVNLKTMLEKKERNLCQKR